MLCENLKALRKSRGLSQEELAVKLNVVRQTVSKWEQGLSVPDCDMLIAISKIFEIPVSDLLVEQIEKQNADDLKVIAEKLEIINLQLAQRKAEKRKIRFWVFVAVGAAVLIIGACLAALESSYLGWNFSDPEIAVAGSALHAFEWLFFRIAPLVLLAAVVGAVLTYKNK